VTDPSRDAEETEGPSGVSGTVGLWFWGTTLVFGAFLLAVPGQDERAQFWWWCGLVLVAASLAGLAVAVRARHRGRRRDHVG